MSSPIESTETSAAIEFANQFHPCLHPAAKAGTLMSRLQLRTFLAMGAAQGVPVGWWEIRSLRKMLDTRIPSLRHFNARIRSESIKQRRPGYVLDPKFAGIRRAKQHVIPFAR